MLYNGGKRNLVQMVTFITFNSFKNLSFRPLPIDKEYVYGNLGDELMQKLQSLRMTNKNLEVLASTLLTTPTLIL